MSTSAATSEPYRPLPAPCYFAHQATNRITVVYGGLADYYGFYDVEVFKGTDGQDAAQLADPANWQYLSEAYYVESHPHKAPQVFALVEGTSDTVEYHTEQYPGPFRLEGVPPFAGSSGYEYFATLPELIEKQLVQTGPQFTGHIVPHRDQLAWVAFTEEPYGSGECPWVGIELQLGAPLDSYTYYQGRRATAEEGAGHGTATLWRQVDGERRYYVEINPVNAPTPTYPKLTPLTLAQVQQWYRFEFTPAD
jgi:hypothetical protein